MSLAFKMLQKRKKIVLSKAKNVNKLAFSSDLLSNK